MEEAWEVAKEHVEGNLHWLPLEGRKRRPNKAPKDTPLLTKAQTELLALLAEGVSPKEAAQRLGRSENTVYVQLKDCRDRLGVANTKDAVEKAKDLGYVVPS